jgi:hypothetical protein
LDQAGDGIEGLCPHGNLSDGCKDPGAGELDALLVFQVVGRLVNDFAHRAAMKVKVPTGAKQLRQVGVTHSPKSLLDRQGVARS